MSTAMNRYQKLSDKIFHLQNLELKNPGRVENLEYDLDNLSNDMEKSIKDFSDKSEYIQKEIMALDSSYQSKMQLKELNQNKIKNELKKAEETLAFMIASHKDAVTKHIDKVCSNMEKELNDMITKQKSDKESLYERIEKLKNIAEKEIPKMKEESENFKKDSNDSVNTLRQMLKDIFGTRPRTKEFLIGYPMIMCLIYFGKHKLYIPLSVLATVGPVSVINTFTHTHTPLMISIKRSLWGVVVGFVIGLILIGIVKVCINIFKVGYKKYQTMNGEI